MNKHIFVSAAIIAAAVFASVLGTNLILPNHSAVTRQNGKSGPDWLFALCAAGIVLVIFFIISMVDKKRASAGKSTSNFTPFS